MVIYNNFSNSTSLNRFTTSQLDLTTCVVWFTSSFVNILAGLLSLVIVVKAKTYQGANIYFFYLCCFLLDIMASLHYFTLAILYTEQILMGESSMIRASTCFKYLAGQNFLSKALIKFLVVISVDYFIRILKPKVYNNRCSSKLRFKYSMVLKVFLIETLDTVLQFAVHMPEWDLFIDYCALGTLDQVERLRMLPVFYIILNVMPVFIFSLSFVVVKCQKYDDTEQSIVDDHLETARLVKLSIFIVTEQCVAHLAGKFCPYMQGMGEILYLHFSLLSFGLCVIFLPSYGEALKQIFTC